MISLPLLKQTVKSNWVMWAAITAVSLRTICSDGYGSKPVICHFLRYDDDDPARDICACHCKQAACKSGRQRFYGICSVNADKAIDGSIYADCIHNCIAGTYVRFPDGGAYNCERRNADFL